MIKDSPDSPEPLNKKPRLSTEEVPPPERAKGTRQTLRAWYRKVISVINTLSDQHLFLILPVIIFKQTMKTFRLGKNQPQLHSMTSVCVFLFAFFVSRLCRSSLAPHHVDQSHHGSQFQEAPRVCWKSELRQQQV